MNTLAKKGKNQTLIIFIIILFFSIYTIINYNILLDEIIAEKLVQQIIRFCLTILLIYFVFKGKKWAIITFTILFSIAIPMGIVILGTPPFTTEKIPIIGMILVYAYGIYHLNFSKSFREYQKAIK